MNLPKNKFFNNNPNRLSWSDLQSLFVFHYIERFIPRHRQPKLSPKVEINYFNLRIKDLPNFLIGFKICHISDIHNIDIFAHRPDILQKISFRKPNIFIISGDSVHRNQAQKALNTFSFLASITNPQNIFVITGNHEYLSHSTQEESITQEFISHLRQLGINFLRNEFQKIEYHQDVFYIIGLDDPIGYPNETAHLKEKLDQIIPKIPTDKFKILISHRPEKINLYAQYPINLVFSGHAHGGQIILPFSQRGLFAPHQGFFPKYVHSIHQKGNLYQIINPGIGDETSIPRFNNPGKIYLITLNKAN